MTTIKANRRLVRTPFALEKGKVYRLSATGKWTDFIPTTTASGYSAFYLKCFEKWRRLPDAKWFSIIGQIDDQRETRFDIGILLEKKRTLPIHCHRCSPVLCQRFIIHVPEQLGRDRTWGRRDMKIATFESVNPLLVGRSMTRPRGCQFERWRA